MSRSRRARLSLESLEARDVPASLISESFDTLTAPALPTAWTEWSSDGSDVFKSAGNQGVNGTGGVVSSAGSRTTGLAWSTLEVPGDTGAVGTIRVDSLVPTFVFTRGTNLGTATPSYVAATITRGASVSIVEVKNGITTTLATVKSPSSAYFSNNWARVSLVPAGDMVAVRVVRQDNGQFLNAQGTWQLGETDVLQAKTTIVDAPGNIGFGRAAVYAGAVRVDDFQSIDAATPPAPPTIDGVNESFDALASGEAPAAWDRWTAGPAAPFVASTSRALSPANGFTSNGGSTSAARAWSEVALPADVDVSAAIYLNSLIPAQVFARGSNLDTAQPTYYAVTVTRGLDAALVKVVNGASTILGTIKSADYISNQWLRVRLNAVGNQLQVTLYRIDTQQWLGSNGKWSDTPDLAIDLRDATITGGGYAGVSRAAQFAGAVTFDDFSATPAGDAVGPTVHITPLANSTSVSGEVTFRATATGAFTRIEFRLDGQLREVSSASPASWVFDSTTVVNGEHTLTVRAYDAAGNIGTADYSFVTDNPNAAPLPAPTIPRHYSHIRIAALAYSGTPVNNAFEQQLLKNSIDLVVPNPSLLQSIQNTAPNTPQLIYSNVSNLYLSLLTDWLAYADRSNVSREAAFYHVTKATPFSGSSSSSQPVTWFWGAYQTVNGTTTDVTSAARAGRNFNVQFGAAGTTTAIGYTDKFREMNITLARGAKAGWGGTWEYVSAVDASGKPTAWKTLTLNSDGTSGLKQSGTITFDPPADWVAASVGGSARLLYVRFRTTSGTAEVGAELKSVFGRDYVRAAGTYSGVIPAFDYTADKNGDGYLNDVEFAQRKAGMDARFVYESRLFYPYYGQMRFVTNPATSAVRNWAAEYHTHLLEATPLADGIMLDNSTGRLPFPGTSVVEPTANFSNDAAALVGAVSRAIAPHWVLSNTAGGREEGNAITAASGGALEEFLLRPLTANWAEVNDAADLVAGRLAAAGDPYLVLDSLPDGGSSTDARTQLATVAYYYLLADPERTFLMFYGGYSPSTTWTQHWSAAVTVDVGKPTGEMREFAGGTDPLSPSLTYKVLARDYEKALVLYKPLSYATGKGEGTRNDATASTHSLGGNYRAVQANGILGPVLNTITLRNGEGAILVKA